MNETARLQRNALRLAECYPPYGQKVSVIISKMESERWRPRIQQAWRSLKDQAEDVRKGVSTVLEGFHNVTTPGGRPESLAVDVVDDDAPLAAQWGFITRLNELTHRAGLMTGILWTPRGGTPLTEVEIARIGNAIATGDWTLVKRNRIGFDSLHIQPVGLKPREAMAGKRPVFLN